MKNLYLLIIGLSIFGLSKAQFDCSTAIRHPGGVLSLPLAPIGTIAQSGPDYGCLTLLERPTWFYFVICQKPLPGELSIQFFNNSMIDSTGFIIWGPFPTLSNACSQLTNQNIITCEFDSLNTGGVLLPNIQSGIYIGMLTNKSSVTTLTLGFSFDWIDPWPQLVDTSCNVCNDTTTYINQPICYVTHDTLSGKNKIVWDNSYTPGANEYVILREGIVINQYDSIGFSPSGTSEYTDNSSNPQVKSYSYKLKTKDNCGHEYISILSHKTMHLTASIGINNSVNLNWNQYMPLIVSGLNPIYGSYIIHRTHNGNTIVLDTLSTSSNSYTDLNPPSGQLTYFIEYLPGTNFECASISPIYSNNKFLMVTVVGELTEELINIFPNPAKDKFIIEVPQSIKNSGLLHLKSVDGRIISSWPLLTNKMEIDISGHAQGMYFIEILIDNSIVKKKLLIQ